MIFYKYKDGSQTELIPYDGSAPYINWSEPFSTGLWRYFNLYIGSDNSSLNISIPQNDIISLVPQTSGQEDIDGTDWDIISNRIYNATSTGTRIGSQYLHIITLICYSDVEGEFIEDITIGTETVKVGTQFWSENESLTINLQNFGTELPVYIEKALYQSDIYEDNPDWVLLNNKFKELLQNYMDVLGNKGSYKSLKNSLDWFGYDELVQLKEIWKYHTVAGTKYFETSIHDWLSKEVETWTFNSVKTTYLALTHLKNSNYTIASNRIKSSQTIYEKDPQDNQTVEGLVCMWSEREMRLKMTLLKAFFGQYFVPVHMAVFRSSVEELDWGMLLKLLYKFEDQVKNQTFSGFEELTWEATGDCIEETTTDSIIAKLTYIENFEDSSDVFESIPSIENGLMAVVPITFNMPNEIGTATCQINYNKQFKSYKTYFESPITSCTKLFQFYEPGDYEIITQFGGEESIYINRIYIKVLDNTELEEDSDTLMVRLDSGQTSSYLPISSLKISEVPIIQTMSRANTLKGYWANKKIRRRKHGNARTIRN